MSTDKKYIKWRLRLFSLYTPYCLDQTGRSLLWFRPRNQRWVPQHIHRQRNPWVRRIVGAHPSPCHRLWKLAVEPKFHVERLGCGSCRRCIDIDRCIQISWAFPYNRSHPLASHPSHTRISRSNPNSCKCLLLCNCRYIYNAKLKRNSFLVSVQFSLGILISRLASWSRSQIRYYKPLSNEELPYYFVKTCLPSK